MNPSRVDEFEAAYGPNGMWVELFRKAPGYIRTELLKDPLEPNRYLTIDTWVDRQAYERFCQDFREELDSLDELCEAYTESEEHVGDFEVQ